MTLDESRACLRNEHSRFADWCRAAGELSAAPDVDYEDLLLCLSRRGLPAEFAVCRLYSLTKRPRANDKIESVVMGEADWRAYLKREKFIA
jgi:hypothetical protein